MPDDTIRTCPECGSCWIECTGLVSVNWDLNEDQPVEARPELTHASIGDNNRAWCLNCEWQGIVEELNVAKR